jgi:hypothetical protein
MLDGGGRHREALHPLNPFDPSVVKGSILKVEDENFRDGKRVQLHELCISAKRYALFCLNDDGSIDLRKCSEHGLGHLLNPLDPDEEQPTNREQPPKWIRFFWEVLIRRERGENPTLPEWIDRPALSRVGATTPDIVRRLNHARKRAPYAEQVKPTNFGTCRSREANGNPRRRGSGAVPINRLLIEATRSGPANQSGVSEVSLFTAIFRLPPLPVLGANRQRVAIRFYEREKPELLPKSTLGTPR